MQTTSQLQDLLHNWSLKEPDRLRPHPFYSGVYQAGTLNITSASSEASLAFIVRSVLGAIAAHGWIVTAAFDPSLGWRTSIHKPLILEWFEADSKELAIALLQAYLEALQ